MRSSKLADRSRLVSLDDPRALRADLVGAKAAMLARARRAGLAALPGYVVPIAAGSAALRAGCAALATRGRGAARSAVLGAGVRPDLVADAGAAVAELGGRVIVRSSSELESDARWSGAFSSIVEIGVADIEVALRTCWAAAFAPDPLDRLGECGLEPERLGLALLIQAELVPIAGGTARLVGEDVEVVAVAGHPGGLLAGLVDGNAVRIPAGVSAAAGAGGVSAHADAVGVSTTANAGGVGAAGGRREAGGAVAGLLGAGTLAAVVDLARRVGDIGADAIEWAVDSSGVWLLQATASAVPDGAGNGDDEGDGPAGRPPALTPDACRIGGHGCVEGDAAGPLVFARPHETVALRDGYILVAERPVAALAPLLFGARGVVCQNGPPDSHLAGVARAIGVPMLVQVPVERVTGPLDSIGTGWLAAIDGRRGELLLTRRDVDDPMDQHSAVQTFIS